MRTAPLLTHREVVSFVRRHRSNGRGAGWIDIHLLASASTAGLRLWTVDPRLEALASELRIAYRPA